MFRIFVLSLLLVGCSITPPQPSSDCKNAEFTLKCQQQCLSKQNLAVAFRADFKTEAVCQDVCLSTCNEKKRLLPELFSQNASISQELVVNQQTINCLKQQNRIKSQSEPNLQNDATGFRTLWTDLDESLNTYTERRKILIFIDGTGQTGKDKTKQTNVWKMYQLAVQHACHNPIIPYYQEGIGTDYRSGVSGSAFGLGIDVHIRDAYQFLVQTYRPNDEIFIFGFSRGAYTARTLNGMIEFVGLLDNSELKQDEEDMIQSLFQLYYQPNDGYPNFERRLRQHIQKGINKLKQQHNITGQLVQNVKVRAIGVFDTVPALGVSRDDYPDDYRVSLYAEKGFHALALDEQRDDFRPLRFDQHQILKDDKLKEVWFAGDHSDVGGGYGDDTGLERLSREWMLQQFAEYDLFPMDAIICGKQNNLGMCDSAELHDGLIDAEGLTKLAFSIQGLHWRRPDRGDKLHASVICRLNIEKLPIPHIIKEHSIALNAQGRKQHLSVYRPQTLYFKPIASDESPTYDSVAYKMNNTLYPNFYEVEPYLTDCETEQNQDIYGCLCGKLAVQ